MNGIVSVTGISVTLLFVIAGIAGLMTVFAAGMAVYNGYRADSESDFDP